MKLNDVTLLTAYLDQELSERQRLAVEAALHADPRLAAQLRELAAVRGLVAGLSRPGPGRDLSGPVTARLARRRWALPALSRPAVLTLFSSMASAAALLLGLSLWLRAPQSHRTHSPSTASQELIRPGTLAGVPAPSSNPSPKPTAVVAVAAPAHPAEPVTVGAKSLASAAGPDAQELASDEERKLVQGYLDGARPAVRGQGRIANEPGVRRIMLTADQLEPAAFEVQELLSNTPRPVPRYGRITVSKGCVLDPSAPGDAVVFVLVIDDKELRLLRDKLQAELHLSVHDDGLVKPELAAMLGDIGQVDVLNSPLAPLVVSPPELAGSALAIREPQDRVPPPRTRLVGPGGASLPVPAGARPDTAAAKPAEPRGAPEDQEKARPEKKPTGLMTVLLWLKTRDPQSR